MDRGVQHLVDVQLGLRTLSYGELPLFRGPLRGIIFYCSELQKAGFSKICESVDALINQSMCVCACKLINFSRLIRKFACKSID